MTKISHINNVPGMYIQYPSAHHSFNIFINLKKTPPLGFGSHGKIRKVLWLNSPNDNSRIVAKKVLIYKTEYDLAVFDKEIKALRSFSNKKGIISIICGGSYQANYAIFLPCYQYNLFEYPIMGDAELSLEQKLIAVSQLLEGLFTISKQGVHGDIKPANLLLRKTGSEVEAVISDFGSYHNHNNTQFGLTTYSAAPPEYYKDRIITLKHDVWGMGISLYEFFSPLKLPYSRSNDLLAINDWVSKLEPGWLLGQPIDPDTPPFFLRLLNDMLDPRVEIRPDPEECFNRFSVEYEDFNNNLRAVIES